MSANAYRVYPTKSDTFTFDVGHDEKLMDFFNEKIQFYLSLNFYGTGIVDVPVELLEQVVALKEDLELDEDTVKQIQLDIMDGKSRLGEVVSYHCF